MSSGQHEIKANLRKTCVIYYPLMVNICFYYKLMISIIIKVWQRQNGTSALTQESFIEQICDPLFYI